MNIEYRNLDTLNVYPVLQSASGNRLSLREILSKERVFSFEAPTGGELSFNYAAAPVDEKILTLLEEMTAEQQVKEKFRLLAEGEIMNTGEQRMVLHHLCRGELGTAVVRNGRNFREFYESQRKKFSDFAHKVHTGEITGSTGKKFTTAVQIGIGGSDLGPRALYLALENLYSADNVQKMNALFISNVDPDDAAGVVRETDPETTLFILVSKSGTTQETLTNREFVIRKMKESGIAGLVPEKHMVAVTSETSPLADSPDYLESFYIDDFIGGRYSATSAVGGVVLSLAFGPEVFEKVLEGAHDTDTIALNAGFRHNGPLLDAAVGVWLRNFLGLPASAILPYSQALHRFPAHLQQLDMESNGKRVNRKGEPVHYATGPLIFGEPGTNGQHSFYQLLHQGTDIIPLQFIGFRHSQMEEDIEIDGSTSQTKLNANLAAQIIAFVQGKVDENPNREFPGERPSTLIRGDQLTPMSLGALLAHYENKVMFQGLIWNINSFDQEGVQLGKILTKKILSGKTEDPALQAYTELLG